jgi:maleate isomerase
VTPYQDFVNTQIRNRLEVNSLTIVNFLAYKFTDDSLMGNLDPIPIEAAIIEADCREADTIFVSCTAIRACALISSLEGKLKKN